MEKKIYGFEIHDNDNSLNDNGFMLYTIKENFLTPVIEKFERGFGTLFKFEEMIKCLKYNRIKTLHTYQPHNCETVCSAPYEINTDYEFELCQFDGKWNRFNHYEIHPSETEEKIFKENKIELVSLTKKEISKLERNLKFQY